MNKNDRQKLQKAYDLIEEAQLLIEEVKDGEQTKYDNLSEGLQQSERGQKFEENASELEDIYDSLAEEMDNIQNKI